MLKQIGQVSWLGRRFVIVLVSRVRKLLPTNTITSGDHAFSYLPRLPILRLGSGQWLVRAAFVAFTVAGQQGISHPSLSLSLTERLEIGGVTPFPCIRLRLIMFFFIASL